MTGHRFGNGVPCTLKWSCFSALFVVAADSPPRGPTLAFPRNPWLLRYRRVRHRRDVSAILSSRVAARSKVFNSAQHRRASGVSKSKGGELLLETAKVAGLCIGVAQFLQLGGRLVVSRSNLLIHERIER